MTVDELLRDAMRREGWRDNRAATLIDHPADKGGLTRGGVTAVNWGDYLGLGRPATRAELLAMTYAQALEFYRRRYLVGTGFDQVADRQLCALLVDWCFTSWSDDPTKALQQSLKTRGLYAGTVDGVFGPKTKAALDADTDPRQTFRDVLAARIRFYRLLALADPLLQKLLRRADPSGQASERLQLWNLAGWQNRCLEFLP